MKVPEIASRYVGDAGENYFQWQARIATAGSQLNLWKFKDYITDKDVVLDFGCGGGSLLANLPGKRKLGVEVNSVASQAARAKGIEVYRSLMDLPASSIDVAISHHALEHTLAPYHELKELRRVLKPGKRIVLWLPVDDWRRDRRIKEDLSNHLYGWTTLSIRNLLIEAGFRVERCHVVRHAWSIRFVWMNDYLPPRVFSALCFLTAVLRRRRQLMVIGVKPSSDTLRVKSQDVM